MTITSKEKKTVLVIAAHPDDEVLGCGGIIQRCSNNGDDCYVLILTDGSEGRYGEEGALALRENAALANKNLGTKKVFFEKLPNQALDTLPITTVIQTLESYINKLEPTVVYTHHNGDLNRDHKVCHEATLVATRPLPGQCVREVYGYNTPSSTEWMFINGEKPFIPNVFVDIAGYIEGKIEAMECYESERNLYPHPRSPEALKAHANYWGLSVGLEYAEPFILIRGIED